MFQIRGIENAYVVDAVAGPITTGATVTGASQDFSQTDDVVAVIQDVGAFSATSLSGNLQEYNPTTSAWVSCNPVNTGLSSVTGANNCQIATYQRDFQYIRYVGTVVGGSSISLAVVLQGQVKRS
jgi:hypothetical protein